MMNDYQFLIAPVAGWLIAQLIKYIVSLRKDGFSFSDFISSGGFPSSHSAFVVSLATLLGLVYGINSIYFAITAAFSAIILYDSIGVRRTTGDQTIVIEEIKAKENIKTKHKIHTSKGHNIVEMLTGMLLGIAIGYAVFLICN